MSDRDDRSMADLTPWERLREVMFWHPTRWWWVRRMRGEK